MTDGLSFVLESEELKVDHEFGSGELSCLSCKINGFPSHYILPPNGLAELTRYMGLM